MTAKGATRDADRLGRAPGARRARGRRGRDDAARDEPEERDERIGRAGDDGLGVFAGHQPGGQVETDLRFVFTLFGGAASFVEP